MAPFASFLLPRLLGLYLLIATFINVTHLSHLFFAPSLFPNFAHTHTHLHTRVCVHCNAKRQRPLCNLRIIKKIANCHARLIKCQFRPICVQGQACLVASHPCFIGKKSCANFHTRLSRCWIILDALKFFFTKKNKKLAIHSNKRVRTIAIRSRTWQYSNHIRIYNWNWTKWRKKKNKVVMDQMRTIHW